MHKQRLCIVVSSIITVKAFLLSHIKELGCLYELTIIANVQNPQVLRDVLEKTEAHATVISVAIERKIAPIRDLAALYKLFSIFRRHRFDAVHSVTPKAGLLAMTAGFLAGIPFRVHTFTGQVWATATGVKRLLLKQFDKIIATLASSILTDSFAQRDFLISQGITTEQKSAVLAQGSISGVDADRFRPNHQVRCAIRTDLAFSDDHTVFLYLGRLNKDKGLPDLASAFSQLCGQYPNVRLLVVGPDEQDMTSQINRICGKYHTQVSFLGYTDQPEYYMAASDVFCLPSYREGFGTSVIEAASVGIPAIASRIYGLMDAIQENVTGFFHAAGDIATLRDLMQRMVTQPELRRSMGAAARSRTLQQFSQEKVTQALVEYYSRLLTSKKIV